MSSAVATASILNASDLPAEICAAHPRAASYIRAFAGECSRRLVGNVQTAMYGLHTQAPHCEGARASDWLVPVTVNSGGNADSAPHSTEPNGYVVSPITTYVHYGYEEARLLPSTAVRGAARAILAGIHGTLSLGGVDENVILNNWLVSTNVHPAGWGLGGGMEEILNAVLRRWPSHTVIVRSLNGFCNAELIEALRAAGFILCPSRQVYMFDGRRSANGGPPAFAGTRNHNWDAKLLEDNSGTGRGEYEVVYQQPHCEDPALYDRIARLYNLLYLHKYSFLNPHYRPEWFRRGHEDGWLDLAMLRHRSTGRVDGVVGWFGFQDVFTTPVVGYDTALPQKLGLYRMLIALTLRRTIERGAVLNLSSGAAQFKRLRGGVPVIEYSAVYTRHLPSYRQAVWHGLALLLNRIAVPLLQKHEL